LPVTLGALLIDLDLHPCQQLFGRLGRDTGPLKVPNLFPLPKDLAAHVFDLRADGCKLHLAICSLNVLSGKPLGIGMPDTGHPIECRNQ
jgi:hypothetical protein